MTRLVVGIRVITEPRNHCGSVDAESVTLGSGGVGVILGVDVEETAGGDVLPEGVDDVCEGCNEVGVGSAAGPAAVEQPVAAAATTRRSAGIRLHRAETAWPPHAMKQAHPSEG